MNVEDKIIIYQTEDGQTQVDVRMENETVWLTQAQMAELFQTRSKIPPMGESNLEAIPYEGLCRERPAPSGPIG